MHASQLGLVNTIFRYASPNQNRKSIQTYVNSLFCRSKIKRGINHGHISVLTQYSLLRRHDNEMYAFCIPDAGRYVLSLKKGRAELVNILRRKKHGEMLLSKLNKLQLKNSVMSTDWHLKDLLGSGDLIVKPTTVGPLISIIQ